MWLLGTNLISYRRLSILEETNETENPDETTQKTQRKSLPDLDRYWKAVNDDPSDFTAWTYLLQYVEQEVNNMPSHSQQFNNQYRSQILYLFYLEGTYKNH